MGHYGDLGEEKKSDSQAQTDMIDRLLDFGEVSHPGGNPGANRWFIQ